MTIQKPEMIFLGQGVGRKRILDHPGSRGGTFGDIYFKFERTSAFSRIFFSAVILSAVTHRLLPVCSGVVRGFRAFVPGSC
jgi:hypothetical protein